MVGRNTRPKRDNKKNFKNHIISSIITSKDFLSVKVRNFEKNKKPEKLHFYGQVERSVGGAKRIWIWNRNLQTKMKALLGAPYASTCP